MDAHAKPAHVADLPDVSELNGETALEAVLAAWHAVTVRLEQTHETLRDEVRRLTAELEVKNRELARKNRLADLGQIASHVAHEVRNNMVPVALYLSLLRRRATEDPGVLDIINKLERGFTSLDATVNDLLSFTADRVPVRSHVDLCALVRDVLDSLAPQLSAQGVSTEIDVPLQLSVSADRDMLRRAVLNVALNALDAMPDGGELVVTGVEGPNSIELEVADSGPGLNEDVCRRAFEPFFTTKKTGTGLGLAIVGRVTEAHGGDVTALNCPEGGAAFTIRLPKAIRKEAAA